MFVKIDGKKEHVQKRLLLANLRELYQLFQEENPDLKKTGLSTFCSLRPKECITVNSNGSHNVCVCAQHQNVKLMVSAIRKEYHYKELIAMLVCDVANEVCMLKRCVNCPSSSVLKEYLSNILPKELDEDDDITYSQWESTDRCNLYECERSVYDFVDELTAKMKKLTSHHFIARKQIECFKEMKEHLGNLTCLVIVDFSEKYSFLTQDAVQGFHWNNSQTTVHPMVVYFKNCGEVKHQSICFIRESSNQLLEGYATKYQKNDIF